MLHLGIGHSDGAASPLRDHSLTGLRRPRVFRYNLGYTGTLGTSEFKLSVQGSTTADGFESEDEGDRGKSKDCHPVQRPVPDSEWTPDPSPAVDHQGKKVALNDFQLGEIR